MTEKQKEETKACPKCGAPVKHITTTYSGDSTITLPAGFTVYQNKLKLGQEQKNYECPNCTKKTW
jgi:ribosomal protein S27AE